MKTLLTMIVVALLCGCAGSGDDSGGQAAVDAAVDIGHGGEDVGCAGGICDADARPGDGADSLGDAISGEDADSLGDAISTDGDGLGADGDAAMLDDGDSAVDSDGDTWTTDGDTSTTDGGAGDIVAPPSECPDLWPGWSDPCSGTFDCQYGMECCCGECDIEYGCSCVGGHFQCYASDFCLGAFCSAGCSFQKIATAEGCVSCEDARSLLGGVLGAVAESNGACETDADCALLEVETDCGRVCDLAVGGAGAAAFSGAVDTVSDSYCADAHLCWDMYGPVPSLPTCESSGSALCVEGTCRHVAPCDPAFSSTGDACDDGDACTEGDVCTGPLVCAGKAVSCDDANPCTDDTCDPGSGCANEANTVACEAAAAVCTVGWQCGEGACKPSTIPGFTRTYAPDRWARAVAAIPSTGGAMVIGGIDIVPGQSGGFLLWLDPLGEPTATVLTPGRVTSLVALAGGDVVHASEGPTTISGGKTDVVVARTTAAGGTQWSQTWTLALYDREPRLAVHASGAVAVVWTRDEPWEGRYAVTSLDGAVAEPQTFALGYPALEQPVEGRPAIVATDEGFAIAHGAPSQEGRVQITRLDATGAVVSSFVLPGEGTESIRGVLSWSGTDLVVWGSRKATDPTRWVRRVTLAGSLVWETSGFVEELSRVDTVALLGFGLAEGAPTLVKLRFDTGEEIWTQTLPPAGVTVQASAPVSDGIALLGTLWDEATYSTPGHPWLRRTSWVQDCDGGVCPPPGCAE